MTWTSPHCVSMFLALISDSPELEITLKTELGNSRIVTLSPPKVTSWKKRKLLKLCYCLLVFKKPGNCYSFAVFACESIRSNALSSFNVDYQGQVKERGSKNTTWSKVAKYGFHAQDEVAWVESLMLRQNVNKLVSCQRRVASNRTHSNAAPGQRANRSGKTRFTMLSFLWDFS